MGIFAEACASNEANGLSKVLLKVIEIKIKDVMSFCKEDILPLYKNACGEGWSFLSDDDKKTYKTIIDTFNNL